MKNNTNKTVNWQDCYNIWFVSYYDRQHVWFEVLQDTLTQTSSIIPYLQA